MTSDMGGGDRGPVAIICGGGSLPAAVADSLRRNGRTVVMFPVRGWADPAAMAAYPHHWFRVGSAGRFCRLARKEGCREIVMIGSAVRPAIRELRLDLLTLRLLPQIVRLFRGGDDTLLSGAAKLLQGQGFRIVGAHELAPEILVAEGPLGAHRPAESDLRDIERGFALVDVMAPFDVGQAVVVADDRVLAIEAAEGTDTMLDRIAELRAAGRLRIPARRGVLVKTPKAGQDRRVDLPSLGPKTVEKVAAAGLAGIAVAAGEAIIAEPQEVAAAADRAGLFVIGHRPLEVGA